MPQAHSWSIRSRAHHCAETDHAFEIGETFYTALFPDPEGSGYTRRDFSQGAWLDRSPDAPAPFSYWRSQYQPPQSKKTPAAHDSAEEVLTRLILEDDPATENARFILALMLERQKILVETDHQTLPDSILRIYQNQETEEIIIIRDPNLSLNQLESIQREVFKLLKDEELES